jgi:hypothetical protein
MTPTEQKADRNDLAGEGLLLREQLVQSLSEQVREEVAGLFRGQDQNNITNPESPDAIKDIQSDNRRAVATCVYYILDFLERRDNFFVTYDAGTPGPRNLAECMVIEIALIRCCIESAWDEMRNLNNNSSPFRLTTDQLLDCYPDCDFTSPAGRDRLKEIFRLLRHLNKVLALPGSDVERLEDLLSAVVDSLRRLESAAAWGISDRGVRTESTFPAEPMGLTAAGVAEERGDAGEPGPVEGECSPSRTRRGKNEERDKLVYELCCAGIPYKNIQARVNQSGAEHDGWKTINTVSGVRHVADSYAKRHGLPLPEARHHPRERR